MTDEDKHPYPKWDSNHDLSVEAIKAYVSDVALSNAK
jgi:hypothetical protein